MRRALDYIDDVLADVLLVLFVLLAAGAFVLAIFAEDEKCPASVRVQCPTEDSCVIDYRDGAWHITEVRP